MKYKPVLLCPQCASEDIYAHGPEKPLQWYCAKCGYVESYKELPVEWRDEPLDL
jgi:ribosomal protein S27AE